MQAISYFNKRLVITFLLGFSSGLPLALTGSTLQAWFTEANSSLLAIGTLTLLGLPYIWKFLWAPIMDRFVLPIGGRHRGWIGLMQLCLSISIYVFAQFNPATQAPIIGGIVLIVAFFSASQDIAVDAYRTELLEEHERGLGASYYIFAYRLALLVSGGVALIAADHYGWKITFQAIAAIMALMMVVTYCAPKLIETTATLDLNQTIKLAFVNLFQHKHIMGILFFILTYRLGGDLALALMSKFLLHEIGFSLTDLGVVYKTMGFFATIIGAFFAGKLLTRLGIYQALFYFGLAQSFTILLFLLMACVEKNYALFFIAVTSEYFTGGMCAAAFMALFMSLCNRSCTATQFALLSALGSIGRVCIGPMASQIVIHQGWITLYITAFLLSFPSLIILYSLRKKVSFNDDLISE